MQFDRTIRFWHSSSGTLIKSHFTDSQITSLTWSKSTKQVVATFGYGTTQTLLTVYCYQSMKPLGRVMYNNLLRILSTTLSPDGCYLCVAATDSTIRIYKLWNQETRFTSNLLPNQGTFGSPLIEYFEGVENKNFPIR